MPLPVLIGPPQSGTGAGPPGPPIRQNPPYMPPPDPQMLGGMPATTQPIGVMLSPGGGGLAGPPSPGFVGPPVPQHPVQQPPPPWLATQPMQHQFGPPPGGGGLTGPPSPGFVGPPVQQPPGVTTQPMQHLFGPPPGPIHPPQTQVPPLPWDMQGAGGMPKPPFGAPGASGGTSVQSYFGQPTPPQQQQFGSQLANLLALRGQMNQYGGTNQEWIPPAGRR